MSLDATRWAWQQDTRPTHKLVLLSLADRAGEKHECYPSIDRLIRDTGLHKQTIMEAVQQLESLGLIKVSRTDGKSNVYKLIGVKDRTDADQYEKPDRFSDQVEKPTRLKNRTTPVRKTDQDQYEKPYPNLPIESTNNLKDIHTRFDARKYLSKLGVSDQSITDWISVRKAKKHPLTKLAIDHIAIEAEKASMTMDQAIVTCCANSWAGFKASWLQSAKSVEYDYSSVRD